MDENIEFLRDFLECDRYRIAEMIDSVSIVMRILGQCLRRHDKGPFTIIYRDEDDPTYELIQLLDGNNFEVKYGITFATLKAAMVTPLYIETIKVEYVEELETQTTTTTNSFEYDEWTLDPPELCNPPRRGLRVKMLPIDDIPFNKKLRDELLKPP